jgi:hypothetical protein
LLAAKQYAGLYFSADIELEKQLRKKKRQYHFSVYQHKEEAFLNYYLFHNHCDGEYLLPEFRHIDFLFLMKGDYVDDTKCNSVITSIKTIEPVQMVLELTSEQIRNKEHLVF